jgi:hypothetical protein
VKSDGSTWKRLTNDPPGSSHYFPDWSPDGTKIVFNYGQSVTKANIRIIDTTGNLIKDFAQGEFGGPCLWAPDGIHIAGGIPLPGLCPHRPEYARVSLPALIHISSYNEVQKYTSY